MKTHTSFLSLLLAAHRGGAEHGTGGCAVADADHGPAARGRVHRDVQDGPAGVQLHR